MDRKILLGMMMIGLVAALAGAGMYAYFSDIETSSDNVFTAGTQDLIYRIDFDDDGTYDTEWLNGEEAGFTLGPLAPREEGSVVFEIKNDGDVGGELDLSAVFYTEDGGEATEPELIHDPENTGNMDEFGCALIWFDLNDNGEVDDGEPVVLSDETAGYEMGFIDGYWQGGAPEDDVDEVVPIGFLTHEVTSYETNIWLGGGASTYMRIKWAVADSGGDWINVIQGDWVNLNFTWELEQETD